MSGELDALTVVNQLRDLAADPLNRRAIVQDNGCLPGLILFLDHPNPQVVYSALLVSTHSLYICIDRRGVCCTDVLLLYIVIKPFESLSRTIVTLICTVIISYNTYNV